MGNAQRPKPQCSNVIWNYSFFVFFENQRHTYRNISDSEKRRCVRTLRSHLSRDLSFQLYLCELVKTADLFGASRLHELIEGNLIMTVVLMINSDR